MMHTVGLIRRNSAAIRRFAGWRCAYPAYGAISNLLFAVKTGAIEQELRQQRHRTTGCAFGFP
ncbi:hypothetical protein EKO26_17680 [Citrobacter portucalensis]|jgi:hypothetical protein|nr:hypothetical protein EKO26_17680 [Citrobacter portucalensis]